MKNRGLLKITKILKYINQDNSVNIENITKIEIESFEDYVDISLQNMIGNIEKFRVSKEEYENKYSAKW